MTISYFIPNHNFISEMKQKSHFVFILIAFNIPRTKVVKMYPTILTYLNMQYRVPNSFLLNSFQFTAGHKPLMVFSFFVLRCLLMVVFEPLLVILVVYPHSFFPFFKIRKHKYCLLVVGVLGGAVH